MVRRVLIGSLIFLFGICLYFYPWFADAWNSYRSLQLIQQSVVIPLEKESIDYDSLINDADAYNQELVNHTIQMITIKSYEEGDEVYESLLNVDNSGLMGYIEIPRLQEKLPIYHYSNDNTLSKGVGHIHGSTLPVGGENRNAMLTGHCGLPNQRLFTDLDKLVLGDVFYIGIYDRVLAYSIADISVILPDDVDDLVVEDGRDSVTLITCTPYGVNTHRLIVRGDRVPYDEAVKVDADMAGKIEVIKDKITFMNALVTLLIIYFTWLLIWFIRYLMKHSKDKKGGPD